LAGENSAPSLFYTHGKASNNLPIHRFHDNITKMKLLTLNFLTCARKTCKSAPAAFPLHPKEAELEQIETEMNPLFIKNMLPRLDWEAMKTLTTDVSLLFSRDSPVYSG
jgi:hypothetical protein